MEVWKFGLFVTLLQVGRCFCEEAEHCQPGFSSESHEFKVTRKVLERGRVLGKVSFDDCSGRRLRSYYTEDNRFRVFPDGTVSVKRQLVLHGGIKTFEVHTWDATGNKVSTQVVVCNEIEHSCTQDLASKENAEFPVLLFPVPHSGLNRMKRDWVIPPISVSENEKGPFPKKLVQIRSTKEKTTKVYYSVTGEGADQRPEGLFTCERDTGQLYVTRPLDRELKDRYVLRSHAVSENGDQAEGPMDIIIKVTDQNDNRPVFTEALFKGAVAEGATPGTSVMTITATDMDDAEFTNNGIVRYSILNQEPKEPADHMFTVNTASGVISVIDSGLDRKRVRLYTLIVQAADMEGNGLTTTASVEIEILNINDSTPIFDPKTIAHSVRRKGAKNGCDWLTGRTTKQPKKGSALGSRKALAAKRLKKELEAVETTEGKQCNSMSASPTSPLTTHVLNTASGTPVKGLQLQLSRLDVPTQKWVELTTNSTNSDGRCPGILSPERFTAGTYKLRFETGEFWKELGQTSFYPYVEIVFTILDPSQKFHIPLLLSPYSYTTYRGS